MKHLFPILALLTGGILLGCSGMEYSTTSSSDRQGLAIRRWNASFSETPGKALIPAQINGQPVKEIANRAFYDEDRLTSLIIPEGVTSIGSYAFHGCDNLTSVTLPSTLKTIDDGAFGDCKKLTSVTIPEGVTRIGRYAFASCPKLVIESLPMTLTKIEDGAFFQCTIKSVTLTPESGNIKLGSAQVNEWVISVQHDEDFRRIVDILDTLPEGASLRVEIGENVTKICDDAFSDVSLRWRSREKELRAWLETEELPTQVTTIGERAFKNLGLKTLIIPETVTSIAQNAFEKNDNAFLPTIHFRGEPPKGPIPLEWYACYWLVTGDKKTEWEAAIASGQFKGLFITYVDATGSKTTLSNWLPCNSDLILNAWNGRSHGRDYKEKFTQVEKWLPIAIIAGDLEYVKTNIKNLEDLNKAYTDNGFTAGNDPRLYRALDFKRSLLDIALFNGQFEIADFLYDSGCAAPHCSYYRFWDFVNSPEVSVGLIEWLERNAIELQNDDGSSFKVTPEFCLQTALEAGNVEVVKAAHAKYKVRYTGEFHQLVNLQQSGTRTVDVVRYLIEQKMPVDNAETGYSALAAIMRNNMKFITDEWYLDMRVNLSSALQVLIENGANVNVSVEEKAISTESDQMLTRMAEHYVDSPYGFEEELRSLGVSQQDATEATLALKREYESNERAFAFAGTSPYATDAFSLGVKAGIRDGSVKDIRTIIFNALDKAGKIRYVGTYTPALYVAVQSGDVALVQTMLDHGATLPCYKIDPRQDKKLNAIDVASPQIAQLLRQTERKRAREAREAAAAAESSEKPKQ